jgi:solute carrier family 35 protein E1
MALLFFDGLLNFCQNILAFTLLSMVAPLTYAVANATKRIAIIGVSILLLRNPVSVTNLVGMSMAVCGVFLYNRAKHLEGRRRTELPRVVKNDSNFNYLVNGTGVV